MTLHVFVGYDAREHAAWMVCRDTILNPLIGQPMTDVEVHPLCHRDLRRRGLFTRPWRIDEKGQFWDERDERPFSTEFSHTRFMVPHLAREMGINKSPVVFMDCDWMFIRRLGTMLDACDTTKAISVVKHDFSPREEGLKMDGMVQQAYPRKLWSSMIVFNMGHEQIDLAFDPRYADLCSGASLHRFSLLKDEDIGEIDESWNWIPSHSPPDMMPNAVHWSFGGPWMKGYENVPYAAQWRQRYGDILRRSVETGDLAHTYSIA